MFTVSCRCISAGSFNLSGSAYPDCQVGSNAMQAIAKIKLNSVSGEKKHLYIDISFRHGELLGR